MLSARSNSLGAPAAAPGTPTPDAVGRPFAIAVEPGFDFGSTEYRALFNTRNATAFQAPRWIEAIHRALMPRLGARQHTITVRTGGGELAAVLPMAIQRVGPLSVMQPADFGVCDANAVVGAPETLEALAADHDARERLGQLTRPADVLFFRKVRRDGFDVRRLFDGAVASPCENAAYHSETGADFEVWQRQVVSRKFTKELGRLNRQIAHAHGAYEHRLVTTEGDIRSAFALLRQARKDRFEFDLLGNPVYAEFYSGFAIAGAASGDALTYVSMLAGEPIAVLVCVGCEDQAHAVLIGADLDRFGRFSPGMQLLYRVIKERFDRGLHRLDFGLGNTGYKSLFRVEETLLDNVTWSNSLAGSAACFVYHRSKPLKNRLRRLAPRLR